ncbi:MAG: TIGR02391 family protein [Steroidobacteraceae bacterium]|jgi:hypothetical protein
MASKQRPLTPGPAILSTDQITRAVPALERRIAELKALEFDALTEENGDNILNSLAQKVNATLREIFGPDAIEYREYKIGSLNGYGILGATWGHGEYETDTLRGRLPEVKKLVNGAISTLETARDILKERIAPDDPAAGNRVLRAYDGMELHPEIARAASKLYQDGHYAGAVEAAVKALNALVRYRSGSDLVPTIADE